VQRQWPADAGHSAPPQGASQLGAPRSKAQATTQRRAPQEEIVMSDQHSVEKVIIDPEAAARFLASMKKDQDHHDQDLDQPMEADKTGSILRSIEVLETSMGIIIRYRSLYHNADLYIDDDSNIDTVELEGAFSSRLGSLIKELSNVNYSAVKEWVDSRVKLGLLDERAVRALSRKPEFGNF